MFKLFVLFATLLILFAIYLVYWKVPKIQNRSITIKSATLYTKSYCPYCTKAEELCKTNNIDYNNIDLENSTDISHEDLLQRTGQRTVPYVYLDILDNKTNQLTKMKFIGGYTEFNKFIKEIK